MKRIDLIKKVCNTPIPKTRYDSNFYCWHCDSWFDEEGEEEGYLGECWGQDVYERYSVCPYCGHNDYQTYEEYEEERVYGKREHMSENRERNKKYKIISIRS